MSSSFWNKANCVPPLTVSCLNQSCQFSPVDLKELSKTLLEITDFSQNQKQMAVEFYLLSRLIYKLRNQLRRDKAFKALCKVEHCLKKLKQMTLFESIAIFNDLLPSSETLASMRAWSGHLPSRQMLEHILVLMMGTSQLLMQTINYIHSAYQLVLQQLSAGLFVYNYIVFEAILSRLWVLCRLQINLVIQWYGQLHLWHEKLEGTQVEWLPADFSLPENLKEWLLTSMEEVTQKLFFQEPSEVFKEVQSDQPTFSLEEDLGEALVLRDNKVTSIDATDTQESCVNNEKNNVTPMKKTSKTCLSKNEQNNTVENNRKKKRKQKDFTKKKGLQTAYTGSMSDSNDRAESTKLKDMCIKVECNTKNTDETMRNSKILCKLRRKFESVQGDDFSSINKIIVLAFKSNLYTEDKMREFRKINKKVKKSKKEGQNERALLLLKAAARSLLFPDVDK